MNKKDREEFLSRPAEGNIMRLAQALVKGDPKVRHQITHAVRKLVKHPGVADMAMRDVIEAVWLISEKEIEGTGALAD
jgi:hypothetical protein